jgi:EAL domain-containing protein (putative c-di-GMP-specific phosphodiesterase class I)
MSFFPTILLFTTIFRIALNVSSTRLILTQGSAGEVIEVFGSFVGGGDLIVGAIIYIILIIVQLMVINKGSERVAEVSARFTLDAMPGKQMAIDADLNTGAISDQEAKLRREKIQNEDGISWVMITSNIMNFRLVNTLFSVQKGNEILIRTASMLRRISERANGLCGRLGGDQFGLLIPAEFYKEKDLQDAACTLAEGFHSGIFTFCIHFGVYQLDDSTIPVSVMCGRANSALRTIRDDMSQTIAYFNDDILQKILFEQKVLGSFEKALKDGEFRMYLQPLVEGSGKVIGAEALARWYRSDGIVVMPGDFIEILEDAGQIQKLDVYIWELAVKQLSIWKETERSGLSISVNMSAKDLFSIDVYDVLTKLIEKYGVDSSALRLEITETALLVDPEKSDAVISRLRQRGFIIEIDDFGKGYSSLGLLKNITADVIKIDMSFLQEIRDNERNALILRSVIGLSDSLGMDVITEGVETQQQLQVLTEMGCNLFQGYYFSRPLPVDIFEKEIAV